MLMTLTPDKSLAHKTTQREVGDRLTHQTCLGQVEALWQGVADLPVSPGQV